MSKPRPLSYKWILLGAGLIFGLNITMRLLLADPVRTSLITSFSGVTGVFVFIAIVAFFSFFVGGALIGYFSPGETIKEPAIAAVIAISLNGLDTFRDVNGTSFTVTNWFVGTTIMVAIGFVMALGGAWLGEKIQGPTHEKLHPEEPEKGAEKE